MSLPHLTTAERVKRFRALLTHSGDMDPAMVFAFCEEVMDIVWPIQKAAVAAMEDKVSDA